MSDDHLLPPPDTTNWRAHANCHPHNRPRSTTPAEWTDRWFTTIWQDWAADQCATCPAKDPCGDEGRDQIGMWGGHVTGTISCRQCGRAFDRPTGRGTPPKMCSDECRYAARLESNRRQRALRRGAAA